MPKKKGKRDHKISSGLTGKRKARRLINRLTMKVNRWNRYKEEIEGSRRSGSVKRWNTEGLESHIQLLKHVFGL